MPEQGLVEGVTVVSWDCHCWCRQSLGKEQWEPSLGAHSPLQGGSAHPWSVPGAGR